MPVIRNPFKKTASVYVEPKLDHEDIPSHDPSVPRSEAKTPAISILSQRDDEADSYKLCVVNGRGEYLPPSPPEKKGFWKRSNSSSSVRREEREALRSADHLNEVGFAISRESFEGYRRSFDISARSPILDSQRGSLDSRRSLDRPSRASLDRPSRASLDAMGPTSPLRQSFDSRTSSNTRLPPAAVQESGEENEFKDVDLNDAPHPKKKSFLSRFAGGEHSPAATPAAAEQDPANRSRSSTLTWKKDVHKGSEEMGNYQPDTAGAK